MRQFSHRLQIATRGKGLYEITDRIAQWLRESAVATGLLTVFVQHTSASLTIQENADPDVVHDLNAFFNRLVAEDNRLYRHTVEVLNGSWRDRDFHRHSIIHCILRRATGFHFDVVIAARLEICLETPRNIGYAHFGVRTL